MVNFRFDLQSTERVGIDERQKVDQGLELEI